MVVVPGTRGRILDRNGSELAISEDAATIIATPYQVEDPPKAAKKLAPILGARRDELARDARRRRLRFAYLARKVDLDQPSRSASSTSTGSAFCPTAAASIPRGCSRPR